MLEPQEYIRKYGIKKAREYYDIIKDKPLFSFDADMPIKYKHMIDSHDIVEKYKVFDVPRWNFIADYCKKNRISPFDSHNYNSAGRIYDDAVKDVESCQ